MKILMVCLGNICRSPLAEGILRSKILEKHIVASAGTISFHEGEHPDKRSTKTAQEHGASNFYCINALIFEIIKL